MMNRKIIVVPCVEKRRLYVPLSTIDCPGYARFVRIRSASTPPTMKNPKDVTMYRMPISLWFVVVSHRLSWDREVLPYAGVGSGAAMSGTSCDAGLGGGRHATSGRARVGDRRGGTG